MAVEEWPRAGRETQTGGVIAHWSDTTASQARCDDRTAPSRVYAPLSRRAGMRTAFEPRRGLGRLLSATAVALVSVVIVAAPSVQAQQAASPAAAPAQTKPKAAAPAGGAAQTAAAPQGAGNAQLAQRVEQLEAQIVDLQVVIGTLESLAHSGGPRPAPAPAAQGGGFGGDQGRLDTLETQIRALTSQVEQLSQQMQSAGPPGRRSDAATPAPAYGQTGAQGGAPAGASSATAATGFGAGGGEDQSGARFGSTTVTSDSLEEVAPMAPGAPAAPGQPAPPAGQTASLETAQNPKQAYEEAYGFLLQQDYTSAQAGFSDFLKRFPKDRLAPDALYWLGEVHYVQRNFASAAEAFDLVTATYGTSSKAPDALLKRGMSLAQLGKKQEACAAWRDIGARYPSAPVHVKSRADSERQRVGCT